MEIKIEHLIDLIVQIAERLQKMRQGCIAVAGRLLRSSYGSIKINTVGTSQSADKGQQFGFGVVEPTDEYIGNHQCPRVDKRIAGNTLFVFQLHQ